ncbi:hypothetical protein JTB14_009079 [Gonioctena quinquepunctata]|nr:hypothetical protein JTB14_009079 [Gonioctena quinquepunctata]
MDRLDAQMHRCKISSSKIQLTPSSGSPSPIRLKSMHQPCNTIPLNIQNVQTTGFNINTIQMYGTTYKRQLLVSSQELLITEVEGRFSDSIEAL